jgi:hypothetical protein
MARQRKREQEAQRETRRAPTPASTSSLQDALHATHQHSVPVLPAHDATEPPTPTTRHTAARPTLTSAALKGSGATGRQPAQAPGNTAAPARRPPVPRPSVRLPIPPAGPDGANLPTAVTPNLRATGLPALIRAGDRRVAPAADPAAPPAILIRGARKPPRRLGPIVPRRHGPRSFTAQFIISMVTMMLLFSALTLASPLGATAAFGGGFKAYANALPWIPTPTPSPTPRPTPTPVPLYIPPHGADPGTQAIINEIIAVFGPNAQGALNVAHCESGYDPNAWNPFPILNSHASGVFQILYPSTWNGTSYHASSPFDYNANIHAAYEIFSRDGFSWREWECQP